MSSIKDKAMAWIALLLAPFLIMACGAPPSGAPNYRSAPKYADVAADASVEPAAAESAASEEAAGFFSTGGTATVNDAAYDATFFDHYGVNPFVDAEDDPFSTFAMDVDTASYAVARRFLRDGHLPDPDAVRVEEFVNYFPHSYAPPAEGAFAIHLEGAPSHFGAVQHKLLRIGLQAKEIDDAARQDASLIFVIDVSGSMDMENRLGLVKQSLRLLVDKLRPTDEVGIVVYGSEAQIRLQPTSAANREVILTAIDQLRPAGSTYAEAGLRLAYQMAEQLMERTQEERIVRLVLCSDGVANVGNTGPDAILRQVQRHVDDGITLSTIGFGMGNYNDVLMEQLANDGNGNYAYVDTLDEAQRIFVENLTGLLQVIAYDAKIQVEFNPEAVRSYRLIGYENRNVADDDFRNDAVDAGEVGAGHSVTALYEIKLEQDAPLDSQTRLATTYIRYADPLTHEVHAISRAFTLDELHETFAAAGADFRLDAAVAEYAEILRDSYWAQDGSLREVRALVDDLAPLFANDPQLAEDVADLGDLVRRAERIAASE